jgi:hypothetical protein
MPKTLWVRLFNFLELNKNPDRITKSKSTKTTTPVIQWRSKIPPAYINIKTNAEESKIKLMSRKRWCNFLLCFLAKKMAPTINRNPVRFNKP